jgi:hypothetical protein
MKLRVPQPMNFFRSEGEVTFAFVEGTSFVLNLCQGHAIVRRLLEDGWKVEHIGVCVADDRTMLDLEAKIRES